MMGQEVVDVLTQNPLSDFVYLGKNLAKLLKQNLTQQVIKNFLQTKESYMLDILPEQRQNFSWSSVSDRYIKWQIDTVELSGYMKRQIGWNQESKTNYNYIITIIDTFSKYAIVSPMKTKEARMVGFLLDKIFSIKHESYKPSILLSDAGTEFDNKYVSYVCKYHKVFQIISPPRRPLGIIERFNQTLKRKMKKAIAEQKMTSNNFEAALERVLSEYNTTIHNTTKFKPLVVHFTENPNIIKQVSERIQNIKQKNETKFNSSRLIPFNSGDIVRITTLRDPTLTSQQRNEIKQAFLYKKFARNYWSKHRFIIYSVLPNNYFTVQDYPGIRFHHSEIQPVKV
jgi:hypothetical protein